MVRSFEPTWENGECTFVLNESMTTRQRIDEAFSVPPLLNERRLLTKEELDQIEYTELEPDRLYRIQAESGAKYPIAFRMSTDFLRKHGFLERLAPIRAKLLTEEFKSTLEKLTSLRDAGTRYLLGVTQQPSHKWNSVRVTTVSQAEQETRLQSTLAELTAIVSEATELAIPEVGANGQEDMWYQRASLTIGSRKNHLYTCVQLNYSKEGQKLSESLKKFGGVHRDQPNDSSMLTAVVSLSHFSKDYFGGRFNVTSLNITAPLLPYEIVLFPARFFHCSTGLGPYSVSRDSPLRHSISQAGVLPPLSDETKYSRLIIPLWATTRLLRPELRCLNEHMYTNIGQAIFEDYAHHLEWMMHLYIVHEPEIILRLEGNISSKAGSGPQQLLDVARAAETKIDKAQVESLTANIPRTGIAKYYVSLFTCRDPATGQLTTPRLEEATKTLNAFSRDKTTYQAFYNDMNNLVRRIGGNSSAIPIGAKGERAQRKGRHTTSNRVSARYNDGTPGIASVEETSKIRDANGEGIAMDCSLSELSKLMNQVTAAKAEENDGLTNVVATLRSVLKDLIAYTIRKDDNRRTAIHNDAEQAIRSKNTINEFKRVARDNTEHKQDHKKHRRVATNRPRDIYGRWVKKARTGDLETDTDTEYEVERIVAKRPTKSGPPLYRVRWKGWDPEWDEWKTARQLEHATDLVAEYERRCDGWNKAASMKGGAGDVGKHEDVTSGPEDFKQYISRIDKNSIDSTVTTRG